MFISGVSRDHGIRYVFALFLHVRISFASACAIRSGHRLACERLVALRFAARGSASEVRKVS